VEERVTRPHAAILAMGTALSLVLAACGAPGLYVPGAPGAAAESAGPGASTGSGANGPATAWGRAIAGIHRDGTVPLETALAAFSVVFGPLPGVEPPTGDPAVAVSASGPTRWILNHWDELTPDQQAAVHRYLAVDGPISIQTDPVAALNPLTAAVLDQVGFQAMADKMVEKLAGMLNRPLDIPVDAVLRDLVATGKDKVIYANTVPLDDAGKEGVKSTPKMARCQVQIGKATQAFTDIVDQEAVVAHEVFHCFQYALPKKLGDVLEMPSWLNEGAAAWVGEEIAGGGSKPGNYYWLGWMSSPTIGLFTREYSAIGFFANLKLAGVDVWGRLDKMELAAVGKSADAYLVAVEGESGEAAVDAWGPSYVNDERVGGQWLMDGPGKPVGAVSYFERATLSESDQYPIVEDPQAAYALRLKLDTDVFVIQPFISSTLGLMYDPSNGTQKLAEVVGNPFCLKPGGCTCPDGSFGEEHQFGKLTAGDEIFLGFTGHTDGINVDLRTFPLDEACEYAPEDWQPPEDCHCPPGPLGLAEPRFAAWT